MSRKYLYCIEFIFWMIVLCENSKRIKHHYLSIKMSLCGPGLVLGMFFWQDWGEGTAGKEGVLRRSQALPSMAGVEVHLAVAVTIDLTWGWGAPYAAAKKEQLLRPQVLCRLPLQRVTIAGHSRPVSVIGRPEEMTEEVLIAWGEYRKEKPLWAEGKSTWNVPVAKKPQPIFWRREGHARAREGSRTWGVRGHACDGKIRQWGKLSGKDTALVWMGRHLRTCEPDSHLVGLLLSARAGRKFLPCSAWPHPCGGSLWKSLSSWLCGWRNPH